jgi:FOG: TPR repeat
MFLACAGVSGAAGENADATSMEASTEEVTVAPDGSFIVTSHAEIKALNEAGAMQASHMSAVYDSETQSVEILEAHTLKKDGSKIPVDVSTIYEQLPPDNSLAVTSFRVKVLLFPQFAAGDTAVYTIRTKNPKPMFAGQFQYGKYFPRSVAFKNAEVTIKAPKSLPLQVETHDIQFNKEASSDTIIYRWRHTAASDKKAKTALVSPLDREPRFFVSSFKSYGDLGRAYAAQSESKAAVTEKVRTLADQITKSATSRREQARLAYEWVAKNIRYVAIELGQGSFVPHDADTILARGYGDCKDHEVLLKALLKAKGIEAQGVLLNATNDYTLTEAPSFAQLNHIITYLPEFGVYLDASVPVAAFGTLPQTEYGKPAVLTALKGAGPVTLPMPKPGATSIHQATAMKVAADGTLTGTTTTSATGTYAVSLRYIGYAVQSMGPEKAAEVQLNARGFKSGAGKILPDPLTDLGDSYTIRSEFSAKAGEGLLKGEATIMPGGLRLMTVTGDDIMGPLYADDTLTDEPTVCIGAKADEDLSLELPPGYAVRHRPDDETITTPNLKFSAHWSLQGNILKVHREFSSTIDQAVCSGTIRKQTAEALKRISKSYDRTFDLIRSAEQYNQDLSLNPKNAEALVNRGVAYQTAGENEKAIADFSAALALKPDAWTYFQRAYSEVQLDKIDAAIEDYTKSIALDNGDAETFSNRAILYNGQGKYDLAIADLNKAITLETDNCDYYNERGRAYRLSGQYDRAIADLTKSISLKPDNALPHYNLGAAYSDKRQLDRALAEYTKAIEIDPDYYYSYWDRAAIYENNGQWDLALKDFDKAIAIEPKSADLWAGRAFVQNALQNRTAALADVEKALVIDPRSSTAISTRAKIRMASGQYDLAIEDLTAVIAKVPNNPVYYIDRARAYVGLKNFTRALADADTAIATAQDKAYYYFSRAQIKHAMGDHKGGNQDSAKATELNPKLLEPLPPIK